eukprot:gene972-2595_t
MLRTRPPQKPTQMDFSDTARGSLRSAVSGLDFLDEKLLKDLYSLKDPPNPIIHTMAAVLLVIGDTRFDWIHSKRILSNPTFLTTIKNIDVWSLACDTVRRLHKYLAGNTVKPTQRIDSYYTSIPDSGNTDGIASASAPKLFAKQLMTLKNEEASARGNVLGLEDTDRKSIVGYSNDKPTVRNETEFPGARRQKAPPARTSTAEPRRAAAVGSSQSGDLFELGPEGDIGHPDSRPNKNEKTVEVTVDSNVEPSQTASSHGGQVPPGTIDQGVARDASQATTSSRTKQQAPVDERLSRAKAEKECGNQCFYSGQHMQALAHYTRALQICPDDKTLLGNRAAVYLQLQRYHECVRDASRALHIDPHFVKAKFRRGKAFVHLGKYSKAVLDLEDAASLESSPEIQSALSHARNLKDKNIEKGPPGASAKGDFVDFYAELGVVYSEDDAVIKKAYHKLCLQWHPDKWATSLPSEQKRALTRFKAIGEAFNILKDSTKRSNYDAVYHRHFLAKHRTGP